MKPTAVWQAHRLEINFCSLLIYLPVAFCAAQDIITACSGDAKHVCLELGWCWPLGSSSSAIWLVTPAHSRLGCDRDRPQGQGCPWPCVPQSERSIGGVSTAALAVRNQRGWRAGTLPSAPRPAREQKCWKWRCVWLTPVEQPLGGTLQTAMTKGGLEAKSHVTEGVDSWNLIPFKCQASSHPTCAFPPCPLSCPRCPQAVGDSDHVVHQVPSRWRSL